MRDQQPTPCDGCEDETAPPLARTVQLTVDGDSIDTQQLCPDCFADWVARYDEELRATVSETDDGRIIVD